MICSACVSEVRKASGLIVECSPTFSCRKNLPQRLGFDPQDGFHLSSAQVYFRSVLHSITYVIHEVKYCTVMPIS